MATLRQSQRHDGAYVKGIGHMGTYMGIRFAQMPSFTVIAIWNSNVRQPEGFIDKRYPNRVLRLNRALSGLKQAPRLWYLLLCQVICSLGFVPLESDVSIYVYKRRRIILAVFVDDVLVIAPTNDLCMRTYASLSKHFRMVNKVEPKMFLGLIIERIPTSLSIHQTGYIDRILKRFNMDKCNPKSTPLEHSLELFKATPDDSRTLYQEIVGSLNHLALFSRPDIS
jgi:Reverse transcriptase (RNA-dependent DNA polymerase)